MPLFSVLLVPLLGTAAAAVDYGLWLQKKVHLQAVADAAATAGAWAFRDSDDAAVAEAERFIIGNVNIGVAMQVAVEVPGSRLRVRLTHEAEPVMSSLLSSDAALIDAAATAEARFYGIPCMLALDEQATTGILVHGSAEVIAEGCVLWSNANGHQSFRSYPSTTAWADEICAVGQVHVRGDVQPDPEAGCVLADNPFAKWIPPELPAGEECKTSPHTNANTSMTLQPGIYCGGLKLENGTITLDSGTYFIKDGPFSLHGNVEVTGENVGIFLMGQNARLDFAGTGRLHVTALDKNTAKTEADKRMKGLVIAHGPSAPSGEESHVGDESSIIGNFTLGFEGTIYLPDQTFSFWGNSDTLVDPPISYIIANKISVGGNGKLRLRSDPDASDLAPLMEPLEMVRLIK